MKTSFDNLAQRSVHHFMATMPPFRAASSEAASEREQENAYGFIKGVYEKLFITPELLGLKPLPDDCFPNWWTPKKEKPGLVEKIRGHIKTINVFMEALHSIVHLGAADGDQIRIAHDVDTVKPGLLKKLAGFDITTSKEEGAVLFAFPKGTVKGLKLLTSVSADYANNSANAIHKRERSAFTLFSRGVFDPGAPFTAALFRELLENKEAFDKVNGYLTDKGFIRVDYKSGKMALKGDSTSLDYVKFYGEPDGNLGDSWRSRNYSGVEFTVDEVLQQCTIIGIHIPFFREVLENADRMSPSLRGFMECFNHCSGCRYCVQTDKTKTKPLRVVKVGKANLCSVFAFGFMFNAFPEGTWLQDGIIELLEFVDGLFADKRGK